MARHVEIIAYKGITFRRYPDAKQWAHRAYYSPGGADRRRGVEDLHREIYKDNLGPIPKGHDVHHKDENPSNNDLSNYELLLDPDHARYHVRKRLAAPGGIERAREHMDSIRPLASKWHGGKEGKALHSRIAKDYWKRPVLKTFTCEECGDKFQQHDTGRNKFCSPACASANRRQSGLDDIESTCEHCGGKFTHNKYAKRKHCSRSCSKSYYWQERRRV